MDFTVTEKAERPAGKGSGVCFYCRQPIGSQHKTDGSCPLVKQRIKARLVLEFPTWMPAGRDPSEYEAHRNLGSNCLNNDVTTAMEYAQTVMDAPGDCMCGIAKVEFVCREGEPYLDE